MNENKSGDNEMKKFFTALSIICLSFNFFLAVYLSQGWKITFVEYVYELSILTPVLISALGVISGIFSLKGTTRVLLICLNFSLLVFFGIMVLIGVYGFQEP